MRVTGAAATRAASAGSGVRAERAASFTLPGAATAAGTVARAQAAAGLLSLQDLPLSPEERRRRAMGRASAMLDGLAELQRDLLLGGASPGTLRRLRAGLAGACDGDADGRLAALLSAVATRCAVELAKRERDERSG
jgi:hypothetical protein